MSNHNADNVPEENQNQKKRRPMETWDIIEIDKRKEAAK